LARSYIMTLGSWKGDSLYVARCSTPGRKRRDILYNLNMNVGICVQLHHTFTTCVVRTTNS